MGTCSLCPHALTDHDDHGCNRCRCGHKAECSCRGCERARKTATVAKVEGLRARVAILTEENAILQRGIEHVRYWYGARFARLHTLAKERGWKEVFSVLANGVSGPDDPPTLQQMYNTERGRAEKAEAELGRLRAAIEAAPHGVPCDEPYEPAPPCDCWKSRALKVGGP